MSISIGNGSTTRGSLGDLFRSIKGIGRDIPIVVKGKASGVYLGGGIKGIMPQSNITTDNDNSFAQTRFTLREAWNTTKYSGQNGLTFSLTPTEEIIGVYGARAGKTRIISFGFIAIDKGQQNQ